MFLFNSQPPRSDDLGRRSGETLAGTPQPRLLEAWRVYHCLVFGEFVEVSGRSLRPFSSIQGLICDSVSLRHPGWVWSGSETYPIMFDVAPSSRERFLTIPSTSSSAEGGQKTCTSCVPANNTRANPPSFEIRASSLGSPGLSSYLLPRISSERTPKRENSIPGAGHVPSSGR